MSADKGTEQSIILNLLNPDITKNIILKRFDQLEVNLTELEDFDIHHNGIELDDKILQTINKYYTPNDFLSLQTLLVHYKVGVRVSGYFDRADVMASLDNYYITQLLEACFQINNNNYLINNPNNAAFFDDADKKKSINYTKFQILSAAFSHMLSNHLDYVLDKLNTDQEYMDMWTERESQFKSNMYYQCVSHNRNIDLDSYINGLNKIKHLISIDDMVYQTNYFFNDKNRDLALENIQLNTIYAFVQAGLIDTSNQGFLELIDKLYQDCERYSYNDKQELTDMVTKIETSVLSQNSQTTSTKRCILKA